MGLKSGDHGAKAFFKKDFACAFQSLKKLTNVRTLVGVQRSQTLAVLDGNVMMNAMPKDGRHVPGYVRIMSDQLDEACQAAAHVVVVFDEPDAMTRPSADEQRRRDQLRQARVPLCSEDLVATITDDNFSTNDLRADGCNVKLLMEFRKARPRFYDAVCVELLRSSAPQMTATARGRSPLTASTGAAPTAAFGVPREAGVLSSDDAFWQPLLTATGPSARATSSSPT